MRADDWRTPPEVWNPLNAEFNFDLDAAADPANALCANYLMDVRGGGALSEARWPGQRVFCNPPYDRTEAFVARCAAESTDKLIVALIPVRTRGAWWHDWVISFAHEVRFVRKRPRFLMPDGTRGKYTMRCDSCIVVWRPLVDGQRYPAGPTTMATFSF